MAKADRQLPLGYVFIDAGNPVQIEDGGKAGPVGAGFAMNENRRRRVTQQGDKPVGFFHAQLLGGNHLEVDSA